MTERSVTTTAARPLRAPEDLTEGLREWTATPPPPIAWRTPPPWLLCSPPWCGEGGT